MRLALYAEDVFLKGRRGDKWSPEEAEFIVWVGG